MSNNLDAKRTKSLKIFGTWVAVAAGGAAILGWLLKGDKGDAIERALIVLGGPIVLCGLIYNCYYNDKLSGERFLDILKDAGIVGGVGASGLLAGPAVDSFIGKFEVLNSAPPQIKNALTAASNTLLIGGACWALIDFAYCRGIGPGEQFARFARSFNQS